MGSPKPMITQMALAGYKIKHEGMIMTKRLVGRGLAEWEWREIHTCENVQEEV